MRQPSPAVRIKRRLAGFRDSDKALPHSQNRQTRTPYTRTHGNHAQGRNCGHKQLLYHNRGKVELQSQTSALSIPGELPRHEP
jgi:hypothetical protein